MRRVSASGERHLRSPVSGKNDFVFAAEGAAAYREDLRHAEVHRLDAGHFAPQTYAEPTADRIRAFAITALRGF
jgi:pimeloyl-ACP methyl ester carboxylesterase